MLSTYVYLFILKLRKNNRVGVFTMRTRNANLPTVHGILSHLPLSCEKLNSSSMNVKNNKKTYSSIPSIENVSEEEFGDAEQQLGRRRRRRAVLLICLLVVVVGVSTYAIRQPNDDDTYIKSVSDSTTYTDTDTDDLPHSHSIQIPPGVNLASWLALEDYFFVGDNGAIEVATSDNDVAAKCLPPLYNSNVTTTTATPSNTNAGWNSETDLFASLIKNQGISHAIQTFHQFRTTYINFDKDLSEIQSLGIKQVRVSLSWCLTEHDPSSDTLDDDENALKERYACVDPYFIRRDVEVLWPAVPKPLIVKFLKACAAHNIKAIVDIHTYPGGTSPGTFSGVWPRRPIFWDYDMPKNPDKDIGRTIYRNFIDWIETLDQGATAGLGGITPMNEPAHLNGAFSYVPSLSNYVSQSYMKELKQNDPSHHHYRNNKLVSVPDGPHLRVLKWQSDAVSYFRKSSLPSKGIECVVNIHESLFGSNVAPNDANEPGGLNPQVCGVIAAWWRGITVGQERSAWAVIDLHHYHAWTAECQGSIGGISDGTGTYQCGNKQQTESVLSICTQWVNVYRKAFDEQLQDDDDGQGSSSNKAKLVSGEFSASTHHTLLQSCRDNWTLRKTYRMQLDAATESQVDLFFWAWKMPYGGAFRSAWSLKQFLYLMSTDGNDVVVPTTNSSSTTYFSQPDKSPLQCGS